MEMTGYSFIEKLQIAISDPLNCFFSLVIGAIVVLGIVLRILKIAPGLRNYLPVAASTIGIFGTFLGIFSGLMDFPGFSNYKPEHVDQLLAGMKTAFFTSIIGILGSMLLKITYRILLDTDKTKAPDADDSLRSIDTCLKDMRDVGLEQAELSRNSAEIIRDCLPDLGSMIAEKISEAQTDFLEKFRDSFTSMASQAFAELKDSVGQLNAWQIEYKKELETASGILESVAKNTAAAEKSFSQCISSISTFDEKSRSISESLQHISESEEKLYSCAELLKNDSDLFKSALEMTEQIGHSANELLPEISQNMNQLLREVKETKGELLQELSNQIINISEESVQSARTFQKMAENAFLGIESSVAMISDKSKECVDAATSGISASIDGMHAEFSACIGTLTGEFQNRMELSSLELATKFNEFCDLLDNTLTDFSKKSMFAFDAVIAANENIAKQSADTVRNSSTRFEDTAKAFTESSDGFMESISMGMNVALSKITKQLNDFEQKLTSMMSRLSSESDTSQQNFIRLMNEMNSSYLDANQSSVNKILSNLTNLTGEVTHNSSESYKAIKSGVDRISDTAEKCMKSIENFADETIRREKELNGKLEEIASESNERMQSFFTDETFSQIKRGVDTAFEKSNEFMLLASSGMRNDVSLMKVDMERLAQQMEISSQCMQRTIDAFRTDISEMRDKSLKEITSFLEDVANKSRKQFDEELRQELRTSLDSFVSAISELSAKFASDYGPLTERLKSVLEIAEKCNKANS